MAAPVLVLDDFATQLHYGPLLTASQDATAGWIARFDGAFLPPGSAGGRNSTHETQLEGATLSIAWQGTSIALFGASSGGLDVFLDDAPMLASTAQGTLASFAGLAPGAHNLTLRQHGSLVFARAEVGSASAALQSLAPSGPFLRTLDSCAFNGQWVASGGSSSATALGDSVACSFRGVALQLSGLVSPNSGLYNVSLDSTTTVLNASAPWPLDTTLFFQNDLDPNAVHSLVVTNAESGRTLALRSVAVVDVPFSPASTMSAAPTSSSPPTPNENGLSRGTVIGLIVAAVAAFVCLAVLLALIWRHYRRRRRRRDSPGRRRNEIDMSSIFVPPVVPRLPVARYPRPPAPPVHPLTHLPRPSSFEYDSRVNSPDEQSPSIRAKISKALLTKPGSATKRDGSSHSSRSRSLSRRSYFRSLNSLHQHFLYDSRDRDDVAINTQEDPDADFRVHDEPEPIHDPDAPGDFEIDADAIFNALSKTPEPEREKRTRGGVQASFLEFATSSSSGHTSSRVRSTAASEFSSAEMTMSASIPYFRPIQDVRSSGAPTSSGHGHRRSSLSFSLLAQVPPGPEPAMGMVEMGGRTARTGIISFSQSIDTDVRTPSDSIPRSVSPSAPRPLPRPSLDEPSPTQDFSAMASLGHSPAPGPLESGQFYAAAASEMLPAAPEGDAEGEEDGGRTQSRRVIPSGQSSQFLALSRAPPRLPPLPPPGPPPSLPHPFSAGGPFVPPAVMPPPASPASPAGRRSPSPPPWPLATRSHKDRVLRKILGVDPADAHPPSPASRL